MFLKLIFYSNSIQSYSMIKIGIWRKPRGIEIGLPHLQLDCIWKCWLCWYSCLHVSAFNRYSLNQSLCLQVSLKANNFPLDWVSHKHYVYVSKQFWLMSIFFFSKVARERQTFAFTFCTFALNCSKITKL